MSDPDVEMFNRNLMKALVADNDKQRAEIERLKAALREIADHVPGNVYGAEGAIARAALEGKFPTKKICPECGQPMREGGYCDHIPF